MTTDTKVKDAVRGSGNSGFSAYRALTYGEVSLACMLWAEFLFALLGPMPGALGLWLRSKCYPHLFGAAGRKLIIGRNVTFRHPRKLRFGDGVVIDDGCQIDAKGSTNSGIRFGDNVFIGRNTIVYCKNGDIILEDNVNISSSCTIFSSNKLTMKPGTMVGAYSYFLSGGEYDHTSDVPFAEQSGMETRGPLEIGANCWIGARVTILDAANVGDHCVIGAGAVVNKPVPANSLAVGIPARVVRQV